MKGFTLIEVLLALAIFTIIGLATGKQIQQIVTTKKAALSQLDLYDSVRTTLSVIRQDLSQAFHIKYEDLGIEVRNQIQQQQNVAHTLFDGRKNELVFTSLSHRVYYAGLRECEQTEISYFLQKIEDTKSTSLMKREAPMIDDDLYQGGSVYQLLDNVESFELQYWDPRAQKWLDDWNSDGRFVQDRFPLAVKIKLVVVQEGKPPLDVQTIIKIAFPNNARFAAKF